MIFNSIKESQAAWDSSCKLQIGHNPLGSIGYLLQGKKQLCTRKRSTLEGHRKALQIGENLNSQSADESGLVHFLVGVFRLRGGGLDLHVSLCRSRPFLT